MNLQENIPTHIKRRIHLIGRVIDNLLPNMYPCDYNSSDHFVEGVLDEIFYFFRDETDFYGIDLISINDFILDYKYDELTEYFNERCIVLKNDNLQESIRRILREENKKSSLLSNIEENGLYGLISNTGLHINDIEQKVGQLSKKVLERFIIDVVKEHHNAFDDESQTYYIYLEDHPFDVVPIGNNDWVEQLIVTNNELLFLVSLYEEDEYGDLEFSSEELTPSKNILYDNIYEIAGQLGFLLSKGSI